MHTHYFMQECGVGVLTMWSGPRVLCGISVERFARGHTCAEWCNTLASTTMQPSYPQRAQA